MHIIKNLILKNNLRKQVSDIEQELRLDGYYKKEKELIHLRFKPDEYAVLYQQIESQFGDKVIKRNQLNRQINELRGKNMFKSHDYTK